MTTAHGIAARMQNAMNGFMDNVMATIDCTEEEAIGIAAVYLKAKIIKYDIGIGAMKMCHGVYWEAGVLTNALTVARKNLAAEGGCDCQFD